MYNIYPEDIAKLLCRMANGFNEKPDEKTVNECMEALYQLKSMAENPYNRECFRIMWEVLEKITEYEWEEK